MSAMLKVKQLSGRLYACHCTVKASCTLKCYGEPLIGNTNCTFATGEVILLIENSSLFNQVRDYFCFFLWSLLQDGEVLLLIEKSCCCPSVFKHDCYTRDWSMFDHPTTTASTFISISFLVRQLSSSSRW